MADSRALMGQPLARVGQIGAVRISEIRPLNDTVYGLGGLAILLAIIVFHEIRARGRPHPAVAIGAPALLVGIVVTGIAFPETSLGQDLILRLR